MSHVMSQSSPHHKAGQRERERLKTTAVGAVWGGPSLPTLRVGFEGPRTAAFRGGPSYNSPTEIGPFPPAPHHCEVRFEGW